MVWFKSCSRCRLGDTMSDKDGDTKCMQCGHIDYAADPAVLEPERARLPSPLEVRRSFRAYDRAVSLGV